MFYQRAGARVQMTVCRHREGYVEGQLEMWSSTCDREIDRIEINHNGTFGLFGTSVKITLHLLKKLTFCYNSECTPKSFQVP